LKVKVVKDHPGEGQFPCFKKGTTVVIAQEEDIYFPGWYACEIDGHKTYAPGIFVQDEKLTRDYNPTELTQTVGDILEVREIVHAWLVATNQNGITGWIPAEAVISIN